MLQCGNILALIGGHPAMCLAVPSEIVEIDAGSGLLTVGTVDFGGIRRRINLGFIESPAIGDYVLVHAGVALSRVTKDMATAMIQELETLVELEGARP
jgi:hydrogenase expression/formation protein HypC